MPIETIPQPSAQAPPAVVLDTNAVLDGLVFDNPSMQPLMAAIRAGALRWLGTAAMRLELAQVLKRTMLAKHVHDGEHTLSQFDALVEICVEPAIPPAAKLLCRDADDQNFIELALRERVRWLVTRDRDLLCLASRARRLQLLIATPEVVAPGLAAEAAAKAAAVQAAVQATDQAIARSVA